MSSKVTLAYCTFPDEVTAKRICEILVAESTAACANIIGPMQSIYQWNGRMQYAQEWAAVLKTSVRKRAALKERFQALHPYATPALVFVSVEDGLPAFLNWVCSQSL